MKPEDIKNKRIAISVLNWGMGHVARCIPIILQLKQQDNTVLICCSKKQEEIFKSYLPDLEYYKVSDYPFNFKGKGNFEKDILFQSYKLYKRYRIEKKEVSQLIKTKNIDLIISDHRYGFLSEKCFSIFITHQLNLPLPIHLKWIDIIHKKLIKRFHHIWILDTPDSSFAGKLSKNDYFKNIDYIGIKSRFSNYPNLKKTIPTIVIISGPEPYATDFFLSQYDIAKNKSEKTVIVSPKNHPFFSQNEQIDLVEASDWKEIDQLILKAEKIISRSGYSTIMDINVLKAKFELYPTIGQKEQIYLSELHQ